MITMHGQISIILAFSLGMYDYSIAPYSLVWHAYRLIRRGFTNFLSFFSSSKDHQKKRLSPQSTVVAYDILPGTRFLKVVVATVRFAYLHSIASNFKVIMRDRSAVYRRVRVTEQTILFDLISISA